MSTLPDFAYDKFVRIDHIDSRIAGRARYYQPTPRGKVIIDSKSSIPNPMSTRKNSRSRRGKKSGTRVGPGGEIIVPENATIYRGPVTTQLSRQSGTLDVERMTYLFNLASTSGGSIATAIDKDPSINSGEWASFAASHDQYRVLSMHIQYVPNNQYQSAIALMYPALVALDHDDATAPTTAVGIYNRESCKMVNLALGWTHTWRMTGNTDALWQDTLNPGTAKGSIKIIQTTTESVSTLYGVIYINWLVQGKGKF